MKKNLFALSLIVLCACGGKRENVNEKQSPIAAKVAITNIVPPIFKYWDNEEFAVEAEITREELLTDTINLYPSVKYLQAILPQTDNVSLEFTEYVYSSSLMYDPATSYRQTYKARLDDATDLSAALYAKYTDNNEYSDIKFDIKFYVKGDTICTLNTSTDLGGFSAEGMTFKISGNEVADVSASYSMLYSVNLYDRNKYRNIQENWVPICDLQTEEIPLSVKDCSYTLPIVKALDLTASDWTGVKSLHPEAIKRWEDWAGEKMDTTNMVYIFELDHILINLNVTYKDGSMHNYLHVAQGLYSEP